MGERARRGAKVQGGIGARRARSIKTKASKNGWAAQPFAAGSGSLPPCSKRDRIDASKTEERKDLERLVAAIIHPVDVFGYLSSILRTLGGAEGDSRLSPWLVQHKSEAHFGIDQYISHLNTFGTRDYHLATAPADVREAIIKIPQDEFFTLATVMESCGEFMRGRFAKSAADKRKATAAAGQMIGWLKLVRIAPIHQIVGQSPIPPDDVRLAHDTLVKVITMHVVLIISELFRRIGIIDVSVSCQAKMAKAIFMTVKRLRPCITHLNTLSSFAYEELRYYERKTGLSFHDIAFRDILDGCSRAYFALRPDGFDNPEGDALDESLDSIAIDEIESRWDAIAQSEASHFVQSTFNSLLIYDSLVFESTKLQVLKESLSPGLKSAISKVAGGVAGATAPVMEIRIGHNIETPEVKQHDAAEIKAETETEPVRNGRPREYEKLLELWYSQNQPKPRALHAQYNQRFGGKGGRPPLTYSQVENAVNNEKRRVREQTRQNDTKLDAVKPPCKSA